MLTVDISLPIGRRDAGSHGDRGRAHRRARPHAGAARSCSRTEIENLPSNGRDFLSFSTHGRRRDRPADERPGQRHQLQRPARAAATTSRSTAWTANGALNGNTRQTISQEAVREFQVVTSQFAPEFGRAAGGLVNIVSRSGTNEFARQRVPLHPRRVDGRAQRVRHRGQARVPAPELRRHVRRAAAAATRRSSSAPSSACSATRATSSRSATPPWRPSTRCWPRGRFPTRGVTSISNGVFPVTRRDTLASLKLDHTLNAEQHARLPLHLRQERRGERRRRRHRRPDRRVGRRRPAGHRPVVPRQSGRSIISPSLLGEARLQVAPRDLTQYANDAVGPRVIDLGRGDVGPQHQLPGDPRRDHARRAATR